MARHRRRARAVLALQPAREHPLPVLVRTAKLRWRIEHDYREMKQALGLAHFEGRTWPGWHHHVTLVSVAHAFCTLQRLGRSPKETASA
ncbi:transposase [Streptomyces sp. ALB3]|uniref:transposase n=1 Tax=Streptomyces sp. ALB3 TaxID=3374278 RepID=UPI0037AB118E